MIFMHLILFQCPPLRINFVQKWILWSAVCSWLETFAYVSNHLKSPYHTSLSSSPHRNYFCLLVVFFYYFCVFCLIPTRKRDMWEQEHCPSVESLLGLSSVCGWSQWILVGWINGYMYFITHYGFSAGRDCLYYSLLSPRYLTWCCGLNVYASKIHMLTNPNGMVLSPNAHWEDESLGGD